MVKCFSLVIGGGGGGGGFVQFFFLGQTNKQTNNKYLIAQYPSIWPSIHPSMHRSNQEFDQTNHPLLTHPILTPLLVVDTRDERLLFPVLFLRPPPLLRFDRFSCCFVVPLETVVDLIVDFVDGGGGGESNAPDACIFSIALSTAICTRSSHSSRDLLRIRNLDTRNTMNNVNAMENIPITLTNMPIKRIFVNDSIESEFSDCKIR
ncbi:hypothetical protein DERF_008309 [Dermatophagoides farinae]|uniref:Uncharacterized protein n=1 Tax=Dermatophagoides farinae TaxID=6954 RepID=A0A922L4M0_DERFA|nr:hypothetical protein DERF_008309 [Dermatophagoides farinae]